MLGFLAVLLGCGGLITAWRLPRGRRRWLAAVLAAAAALLGSRRPGPLSVAADGGWQRPGPAPAQCCSFDATLGFPGEGPASSIILGALNVTHWSCWRKVEAEECARAQLWLLQEHHLTSRHAVKRSRKALARAGWCSVFGLAAPTAKGGTSGGVAVLLRDNFDVLGQLDVHDAERHRAKGVVTRLGGIEAAVW